MIVLKSYLVRLLAAFVLVMVTYNPTQFNFLRWAQSSLETQLPLVLLFGLLLLIGYIIFLRATFRSIGGFGIVILVALVGVVLWVLWDWNIISLQNPGVLTWVGLLAVSFVLGTGLSWSIIRRRLSGQMDVDDVEL